MESVLQVRVVRARLDHARAKQAHSSIKQLLRMGAPRINSCLDVALHLGKAILDQSLWRAFGSDVQTLLVRRYALILVRPLFQSPVIYLVPQAEIQRHPPTRMWRELPRSDFLLPFLPLALGGLKALGVTILYHMEGPQVAEVLAQRHSQLLIHEGCLLTTPRAFILMRIREFSHLLHNVHGL